MDADVSQRLRPTAWGVCSIVLLVAASANAQNHPKETDLENSRVSTSLIMADLRPKLFGDLPPEELAIYNEIKFSVSLDDRVMNAYATAKGGVRRVILTAAIGRATELNGDAFLMGQRYHMHGFLGSYMSYLCGQYQKNSLRYAEGLPPLRISTPYDFARWSEKAIGEFNSDTDINKARNTVLSGAFAFLLAHEVGHHVKGHIDHPASDLAGRRQQESEADAWAIDLLVRKKLNPVDGMIPLLFFFYTDQHPVSTEQMSDHPADATRLLQMYEGLSERLPSFKPYLLGIDYEAARNRVDLGISLIKEQIAASEREPVSPPGSTGGAAGPNSFAADTSSEVCDDLNTYVRAAVDSFRSLRGAPEREGDGQAFYARRGVRGFTDCEIRISPERSIEPSAVCDATDGSLETMRSTVKSCLGGRWSESTRGDDQIFAGPGGITVRLHENARRVLELWVDSPSKY